MILEGTQPSGSALLLYPRTVYTDLISLWFLSGFGEAFPRPISGVYYMEDKVDKLTREDPWRFEKRLPIYCRKLSRFNLTAVTSTKHILKSPSSFLPPRRSPDAQPVISRPSTSMVVTSGRLLISRGVATG